MKRKKYRHEGKKPESVEGGGTWWCLSSRNLGGGATCTVRAKLRFWRQIYGVIVHMSRHSNAGKWGSLAAFMEFGVLGSSGQRSSGVCESRAGKGRKYLRLYE